MTRQQGAHSADTLARGPPGPLPARVIVTWAGVHLAEITFESLGQPWWGRGWEWIMTSITWPAPRGRFGLRPREYEASLVGVEDDFYSWWAFESGEAEDPGLCKTSLN